MRWIRLALGLAVLGLAGVGCHHPSVTAVSLNPTLCTHDCSGPLGFLHDCSKKDEGIPFYLPKPLLIVSKNFRNIEEAKVGMTDSAPIPNYFDDQAKYADLNARTNIQLPDGAGTGTSTSTNTTTNTTTFPSDGKNLSSVSPARGYSDNAPHVTPGMVDHDSPHAEAFYTYHIVFVPDLTQKYGLKIKGGVGEIRAAMNLVNGWQFTGLGPYYMKDSSTAQNTLASGITANLASSGVANVVRAAASLRPGVTTPGKADTTGNFIAAPLSIDQVKSLADAMRQLRPRHLTIPAYAEISIYEPFLSPEGTMEWKLVTEKRYNRDILATDMSASDVVSLLRGGSGAAAASGQAGSPSGPNEDAPPAPEVVNPEAGAAGDAPAAADLPPGRPGLRAPAGAAGSAVAPPETGPADVPRGEAGALPGGWHRLEPLPPSPSPSARGSATEDRQLPDLSVPRTSQLGAAKPVEDRWVLPAGGTMDHAVSRAQGRPAPVVRPGRRDGVPLAVVDFPPLGEGIKLRLTRDGTSVAEAPTGQLDQVVLIDSGTRVKDGTAARYAVSVVDSAGRVTALGRPWQAVPPAPPEETPAPTTAPATPSATLSNELIRQLGGQLAAYSAQPGAQPVAVPAPAGPGSPVTINQFFGKSRPGGAAAPPGGWPRLGLFHKKARPEVRTVEYDLPDVAAPAATTATQPPVQVRPAQQPGQPGGGADGSPSGAGRIGSIIPGFGG